MKGSASKRTNRNPEHRLPEHASDRRWFLRGALATAALGSASAHIASWAQAENQNTRTLLEGDTKVASPDLVQEVNAFIAQYRDAFDSAVVDRISPLYHAPCITVRGDGSVHVLQSKADIEGFFGNVTASYIKDGGKRGRFFDLDVHPIGTRSVLATVTWELLKADDSVLRTWRHSYNLLRTEGTWQILVSTFHLK